MRQVDSSKISWIPFFFPFHEADGELGIHILLGHGSMTALCASDPLQS